MNPMKSHTAGLEIHLQAKEKTSHCDTHGSYTSKCYIGDMWSKCPSCIATETAAEASAAAEREREAKALAWKRQTKDAGIPDRFQDRSLKRFIAKTPAQEKALAFACAYADDFDSVRQTGRSALFIGNPGTGKTHLAAGIALRIMRRDGRTVLFTTAMRALRRVKDTWGSGRSESESEAVAALVFPDLLILDEVGVQFGSETERTILFDILNERYEKRRPTLLLSNLTLPDVQLYLGERVFDRLREDDGEVVVFDWQSWRNQKAAA